MLLARPGCGPARRCWSTTGPAPRTASSTRGHRGHRGRLRLRARVAVLTDTVPQRSSSPRWASANQFRAWSASRRSRGASARTSIRPARFRPCPTRSRSLAAFKEAVRRFSDRTLKPVGSAIAPLLRSTLDDAACPTWCSSAAAGTAGAVHRAGQAERGRVVYAEDLGGAGSASTRRRSGCASGGSSCRRPRSGAPT